jgi:SpoVK/Ycf46/Vps4 family AAA+-type ATPase
MIALINSFSGYPGVGKTLTAEVLANTLGRRLLRIGASDLKYDNPAQVKEKLEDFFEMADSWGSILLL